MIAGPIKLFAAPFIVLKSQSRQLAIHTMLDNNFLRELSQRLSAIIPKAEELGGELRTKIEQQLKRSFSELDILSREEFDSQTRALKRAEQKIQELESLVLQLDSKLSEIEQRSPGD